MQRAMPLVGGYSNQLRMRKIRSRLRGALKAAAQRIQETVNHVACLPPVLEALVSFLFSPHMIDPSFARLSQLSSHFTFAGLNKAGYGERSGLLATQVARDERTLP
eukprot:7384357-Prymnesium_polylepis.4